MSRRVDEYATINRATSSPVETQSQQLVMADSQARDAIVRDLKSKGCVRYELTIATFLELRKCGYQFVTTSCNRAVNRAQVKALKADLKKRGLKKFTTPLLTCSAKVALQYGVQLEDINGNPVDTTHPETRAYILS